MRVIDSLRFGTALVLSASLLGACSFKAEKTSDGGGDVKIAFGDSATHTTELGPDDVRIVSTDNVLVLTLIGDTVGMQLSDSLRNSVAAEIRKGGENSGDQSGIAAMVTKSVSSVVKGAMGFTMRVDARDVENLRYEDGHIRFDIRNSSQMKSKGDRGSNAVFSEEDAKRFIDAVNARTKNKVAM